MLDDVSVYDSLAVFYFTWFLRPGNKKMDFMQNLNWDPAAIIVINIITITIIISIQY